MQTRLRKLALPMLALCLWTTACVMLVTHAIAQAPVPERIGTDGFYWPTGREVGYYNWMAHGCSRSFDSLFITRTYFTGEYHIGEDILTPLGFSVYAIADGQVVVISRNSEDEIRRNDDQSGWGITNTGVIVEHALDSGETFYALYGHLQLNDPNMKMGDPVTAGVPFATIGPWSNVTHLHFGIAPKRYPTTKLGRMICPTEIPSDGKIDQNGFVNPIDWIKTHKPKNRDSTVISPEPAPITLPVPIPLPVGIPLPAQAIIIDTASSQFLRSGDAKYWFTAGGGFNNGSFWWTNNEPATPNNAVTWTLSISQPGSYDVTAFIPATHASTTHAVYEIRHAGGTSIASVNQRENRGQWAPLGTFAFAGNNDEYVRLTDVTGEPKLTTQIGFDAIRLSPATSLIAGDPLSWLSAQLDELKKNSNNWLKDLESLPRRIEAWFNSQKDNAQKDAEQWLQKQFEALLQELLRQIGDSLKQMCVGNAAFVVSLPALSLWLSRRRK